MIFLRLLHGGHSLLKKVRIGFALLKHSFKAVFFNHRNYMVPCLFLALIQWSHLNLTGLIHQRLTMSLMVTELLAGENFFEILWYDGLLTKSSHDRGVIAEFALVLYLQIILIFFVLCAVARYASKKNSSHASMYQCLRDALGCWRGICVWGLFELGAQASTPLLGDAGSFLYFAWNIVTIFDVQILAFDRGSAFFVLKKSWRLFKRSFKEVVAFDVLIEGMLILLGLILYALSKQYITELSAEQSTDYNGLLIFCVLYLISSVMIFEVVVFTGVYQDLEH